MRLLPVWHAARLAVRACERTIGVVHSTEGAVLIFFSKVWSVTGTPWLASVLQREQFHAPNFTKIRAFIQNMELVSEQML